jgi:Protein of unknown function (DUF2795)
MEQRGSSKHGPELDDQMEQETRDITRTGQPEHTEEWRETEPFEEEHLDQELPASEQPGTPAGITQAQVDRRSDIARWLEPHDFPAGRDMMLGYLEQTGAPDEVVGAISRLPARREFARVAEVMRALGIPTEHR